MIKLYKFKIKIVSTTYYEREVVAENEDKAINDFITSLDDNDKMHEENFEVFDIEKIQEMKENEDY